MTLAFRERALALDGTLVLADLHVGRDAASNVQARVGEHEDLTERFGALLDEFGPEEVVVAGDLLHSFSTVPEGARETVDALRNRAEAAGARMVVTPGNHDAMLDALWDGPTAEEYRVGDTVVLHGHEAPTADAERYVVGHDHPVIEIEGRRRPCFLVGERAHRNADVVMVPPFTRLAAGLPVGQMAGTDFDSPLVTDADAFRPVVRDPDADETLRFPPLAQFRGLL